MQIQIAGIVPESVVDGPGIRMVVFCQGCPHQCVGCHNPHTHDANGGESTTTEDILAQFVARPHLKGITLSGGEPFVQAAACAELAQKVQQTGKQVLVYSGYIWEELQNLSVQNSDIMQLIKHTDILIDGAYIKQERDLNLAFRGSKNQRIIDVPKSLQAGTVQLLNW